MLRGQYGEITVAMQYGFQGWNAKMPGKYRDLLFGIGAEEFGHVEMLAVMIAQLIEDAPATDTESAVESDPVMAAVMGQTDVQHAMGAGAGARAVDSNGYHMTDDHGVRDLLSFLLARDTMHQNQWIAAAAQLREEGHEDLPVPSNFPQKKEATDYSYQYLNFSDGAPLRKGPGLRVRRRMGRVSSATTTVRPAAPQCRRRRSRSTPGCTGPRPTRTRWRRSPPK